MQTGLDALRAAGERADPVADAAVLGIADQLKAGVDPLALARAHATRPAVARLLHEARLPPADPAVVARACRWNLRYAPAIGVILATRSLLMLYAMPEIAEVLAATGQLTRSPERRTLETARFLRVISQPESFLPGGPAADAILRVRLLHAIVRHRLRPTWTLPGPPIDQRAMLFTFCVFSAGVRSGMVSLGVHVPPDEAQDHLDLWRHAGRLMGVDEALLPPTPAAEDACFTMLQEQFCAPSPRGRALARALLRGLAWAPPYNLPEGALVALSRAMLGPRLSEILDLPPVPFWARIQSTTLPPLRALDRAGRALPPLLLLAEAFGRGFSEAVLRWRLRGPASYESLDLPGQGDPGLGPRPLGAR